MGLYKRVICPKCTQHHELRGDRDRLKNIECLRCGNVIKIADENAVYYIDYGHSKKRFRERVGADKEIAEKALRKRLTEIAENKFLDVRREQRVRFEDFSQEYLNTHAKQHKKSWVSDEYHIKHFNSVFKNKHLFEITAQDIEHFKMERQKEVSKSTVNRQMGVLRIIFNKAVAWGKLDKTPMKSVKFFQEPEGRLRFLEKDEITKLIDNCDKTLRPIVVLALHTGMRRGEIFNLQWQDIDFKRNIITLLDTKNGKPRKVPMNQLVVTALKEIAKNTNSTYIFCYEDGQRIRDVRKSFLTSLRKSGIKDFHFHDLRHTFASQLVMAGVDLNTVRELLGHKDITMTLRYSHLAQSHKQRAVDMLVGKQGFELGDTVATPEQTSLTAQNLVSSQHIAEEQHVSIGM